MVDHDRFVQALRSFVATMATAYDIDAMCYELCERVTDVVSATGAGVAVATEGRDGILQFVTATSDRIIDMEKAQEVGQQGPCVQAFRTDRPVLISSFDQMTDWAGYHSEARRLGLQSVVGYPLGLDVKQLGALNVYDEGQRDWTDDDLSAIGVFADMATAYLVRISELQEATELADQLQRALDSRVVIEQAKGMIASRYGLSVDGAFEVLRAHARSNNLKLAALADAVVNMDLQIPIEPDRRPGVRWRVSPPPDPVVFRRGGPSTEPAPETDPSHGWTGHGPGPG